MAAGVQGVMGHFGDAPEHIRHSVRQAIPAERMTVAVAITGVAAIAVLLALWQGRRWSTWAGPAVPIGAAAGPTDPDLPFLLCQDSQDQKPLGSLAVFSLHVTTFGGSQFSGDFPAAMSAPA